VDVLRSTSKRKVYNCARQSGKSTVAAIKALHRAVFYPRSMVILLSPSQRQSSELFRKVTDLLAKMPDPPELLEDNKLSLTVANGSRIVSLPSNEKTIRGYSAVDLIIEDEAAAVPDEIYAAVRPMLAVSNGEYNMLSTPRGKRGHFYDAYGGGEWESVTITAAQNARVSAEFLASERKELGSRLFSQEYECAFVEDQEGGVFRREWFADKIVDSHPKGIKMVRRWDRAATEPKDGSDPDYTAGCLMGVHDGRFYVIDMQHFRATPKGNEDAIKTTADLDGVRVPVRMEEEGGSSGKDTIDHYARHVLQGYDFKGVRSTGSKVDRAGPFSAACEAGNVYLVRGAWDLKGFVDELCAFPNDEVHDDRVDAAAGAHYDLTIGMKGDPSRFLKYASAR
jgi:predicted phage terminase large subunit-like protein